MQLTGTQFTNTSAVVGNDISTLPDFPPRFARLPAACRCQWFSVELLQPGHQNARRSAERLSGHESGGAKVNLPDLEGGGTLIINTDGFTGENLKYANYASNPLEDGTLAGYRVHKLPVQR
jgi:2-oxoglutarate ferredoxin oxidoreductase subunit alpha